MKWKEDRFGYKNKKHLFCSKTVKRSSSIFLLVHHTYSFQKYKSGSILNRTSPAFICHLEENTKTFHTLSINLIMPRRLRVSTRVACPRVSNYFTSLVRRCSTCLWFYKCEQEKTNQLIKVCFQNFVEE